jgi:hypothetical protein
VSETIYQRFSDCQHAHEIPQFEGDRWRSLLADAATNASKLRARKERRQRVGRPSRFSHDDDAGGFSPYHGSSLRASTAYPEPGLRVVPLSLQSSQSAPQHGNGNGNGDGSLRRVSSFHQSPQGHQGNTSSSSTGWHSPSLSRPRYVSLTHRAHAAATQSSSSSSSSSAASPILSTISTGTAAASASAGRRSARAAAAAAAASASAPPAKGAKRERAVKAPKGYIYEVVDDDAANADGVVHSAHGGFSTDASNPQVSSECSFDVLSCCSLARNTTLTLDLYASPFLQASPVYRGATPSFIGTPGALAAPEFEPPVRVSSRPMYHLIFVSVHPLVLIFVVVVFMFIFMFLCFHLFCFQFSCFHVLMFSCFHVFMFSCSHVLMFSCSHVFMFSRSRESTPVHPPLPIPKGRAAIKGV